MFILQKGVTMFIWSHCCPIVVLPLNLCLAVISRVTIFYEYHAVSQYIINCIIIVELIGLFYTSSIGLFLVTTALLHRYREDYPDIQSNQSNQVLSLSCSDFF